MQLSVNSNSFMMTALRSFAAQGVLTDELKDHLAKTGIKNKNVVHNPT